MSEEVAAVRAEHWIPPRGGCDVATQPRMLMFLTPRRPAGWEAGKGRADDRLIDDGDFNRRKI